MRKIRKVLLGNVGVDSGQLMITDPAYIRSQWVEEGELKGLKVWGSAHKEVYEGLKLAYPNLYYTTRQHVINIHSNDRELIEKVRAKAYEIADDVGKVIVSSLITSSTYDEICELTLGEENQGGSVPFVLGHEGFAVAFSSGFGDGVYPVYATIEEVPGWGERITKVEIELISDEEVDEAYEEDEE